MYKIVTLLIFSMTVFANTAANFEFSEDKKIAIQNTILAKVGDTTISVFDVKKKMDLAFLRNFSHLADSSQARFQFYDSSWKKVLLEMIDNKLILTEAEEKKVVISDGDIREEIENRFGPNVMLTLDKIDLSYDETVKMIREEMTVQRMMWWFVHSKAINQVTPQDIRQAYRSYLKENPAYDEIKYQVLSIRTPDAENIANNICQYLSENTDNLENALSEISSKFPTCAMSTEYTTTDKQLSDNYRAILSGMNPGSFSQPVTQKSKHDKQAVAKIFILKEKSHFPAPEFEMMTQELKNKLVEKMIAQEAKSYLEKLRSTYPYYETAPKDLQPFSLQ